MGRLPFIAIHFRQQVVINVVFHHSPALRVPEGEVDLGGLTMSLEGGWEELDVFLESLATCSESVFIFARNSAICDSSIVPGQLDLQRGFNIAIEPVSYSLKKMRP